MKNNPMPFDGSSNWSNTPSNFGHVYTKLEGLTTYIWVVIRDRVLDKNGPNLNRSIQVLG